MNNLIKILHWNANGVHKKQNELQALVNKLNIDIIILSETKLSPSTTLKISNYHTFKNDHPPKRGTHAHGDTAVLVHRKIAHTNTHLLTQISTTSIIIKIGNNEVLITSVYKPSSASLSTGNLDKLPRSADWFITAGDFNTKHLMWYSHVSNPADNTF